ncbi:MAG TPA: metalloregulator ArsR/SmtB family transcription factor [Caulobacteraceae bacterium]
MSSLSFQGPAASPAPIFAALGDPTRLSLLTRLTDGETRSIAKLSADTRLSRQAITKHLHVLEKVGLVSQRRVGRESLYAFEPRTMEAARSYIEAVSARWDEALARLRLLVETD